MFEPGDTPNSGAYTVLRVLSNPQNASMGCVYLFGFRENGGIAVGKTFRDELFASDYRAARKCFLREVVTWLSLEHHPNILPAAMFDLVENKPMVFTEFCNNGDLENDLKIGRFRRNLKPVLKLAMQLCDAMSYAKSKGVIAHRDLKPTNLFIKNGMLKVGDFGISQSAASTLPLGLRRFVGSTLSGIGTPMYMAPELWEDPSLFSEQSDIYATGLVLAEMYGGYNPVATCSLEDVRVRHFTKLPILDEFKDSNFRAVVAKCVEQKPQNRFNTFADLRKSLVEVYEKRFKGKVPTPIMPESTFGGSWYYNRAIMFYRLGQIADAFRYMDKAFDENAPNPRYFLLRAGLHESKGNLESAVADCLRAAWEDVHYQPRGKEYEYKVFAFACCVDLFLQLSKIADALEIADGMLRFHGETPISWISKAQVDIEQGKYHDAINRCAEATRRTSDGRSGILLLQLVALLCLQNEGTLAMNSIRDLWEAWLALPAELDETSLTALRLLIQHGHLDYAKKAIMKIEATFCGNRKLLRLLASISRIEKRDVEAQEYERQMAEGVFC